MKLTALFGSMMFAVALTCSAFAVDASKPNIIVILADDLGRGEYSDFGTKDIQTPNIDRLCHEGLTFDNFYANSCVCSPSRAALMTGCFPNRVGVPGVIREEDQDNNWGWLAQGVRLFPQLLKPAGYQSAIVGKWHLGINSPNTPTERGFDRFDGFLGDMMDDYWTHLRHGQNFMRHNQEVVSPEGHATDVFTDWALRYLDERSKSKEPFFLYLAYNAPHDPIQPKPDWLAKVKAREPGLSEKRAKLVALIEHLDDGIGKVLAKLDETGLAKNTIVLFSSDNGGVLSNEANNGPWRSGKTHMYEGGLRVPCMVRWPGHVAPGTHSNRVALLMDILPTALEIVGQTPPPNIDGVSFLPTLLGETQPEPVRDLYFVWREGGLLHQGDATEALRQGDWKLVRDNVFAPIELYNVKDDPKETTDLANKEKSTYRNLSVALRRQIQRGGGVPWQPPAK
ncbi:sulfatase [Chthoniobacter flavus Ellin428]|uniref:Sulfatase n=1 Tax=Chthoniobacter flavus Ellin428 TaxID=497964 RepID=B4D679_9BACT|nr:sulfatase-like hydrolase/transferase [Chthoniobacter flavus]EDY17988.1 sulfatase [Chthoniobacter flavus Ellin428]TCO88230.1 arylsulfatase A-like enzyme [Chthoniobacter flavus]